MDRRGIISWQEWRDLRLEADASYLRAVAGEDYRTVNPTNSTAGLGSNVLSHETTLISRYADRLLYPCVVNA